MGSLGEKMEWGWGKGNAQGGGGVRARTRWYDIYKFTEKTWEEERRVTMLPINHRF